MNIHGTGVDVDDVMSRVQDAVAKRSVGITSLTETSRRRSGNAFDAIEPLIEIAQAKSEVRTAWSGRLQNLLFSVPGSRRLALRLLAFLFRDQRHVNLALTAALREMVAINRELSQRLVALEIDAAGAGASEALGEIPS